MAAVGFLTGYVWLLYSPVFQSFLQMPTDSRQPVFSPDCSRECFFKYTVESEECKPIQPFSTVNVYEPMGKPDSLHYFESVSQPSRVLSGRSSNVTSRRPGHTSNPFRLFKATRNRDGFHLVNNRSNRTLVAVEDGQGKLMPAVTVLAGGPALLKQTVLKIIAVEMTSSGSAPHLGDVCRKAHIREPKIRHL